MKIELCHILSKKMLKERNHNLINDFSEHKLTDRSELALRNRNIYLKKVIKYYISLFRIKKGSKS